ncbi:MAG: hypothetical protein RJA61_285 [Candidatus Parcubacteria bacterium]
MHYTFFLQQKKASDERKAFVGKYEEGYFTPSWIYEQ